MNYSHKLKIFNHLEGDSGHLQGSKSCCTGTRRFQNPNRLALVAEGPFTAHLFRCHSSNESLLTERRTAAQPWRRELAYMLPQQLLDRGGETGDPWLLLTLFQTGGLSNAKN